MSLSQAVSVVARPEVVAGAVVWRLGGATRITVVVKATFGLVLGGRARLVRPLQIVRDEDSGSETAPYLPGAGVLLTGSARAPGGRPVTSMAVRLGVVGARVLLDKTLHVRGPRAPGGTARETFATMPLRWELGAGGTDDADNPVGTAEPCIVDPADPRRAAGFGPIPRHWGPRARRLGGIDPASLRGHDGSLDVPAEMDMRFFHAAPPDQQIAPVGGDEWLVLDGLHPRARRIETRLPGTRAEARWASATGAVQALDLVADTLAIDAERGLVSVLYRGSFAREDLPEGGTVFAGMTLPGCPLVVWPEALRGRDDRAPPAAWSPPAAASSYRPPMDTLPSAADGPSHGRPLAAFGVTAPQAAPRSSAAPPVPPLVPADEDDDPDTQRHQRPPGPPAILPPAPVTPPAMVTPPPTIEAPAMVTAPPVVEAPPLVTAPPVVEAPAPVMAPQAAVVPTSPLREKVLAALAARETLRPLDLRGADLRGIDFSRATLSDCDLGEANLAGCKLTEARLARALLKGADLAGADLTGADLLRADLSRASLAGARFDRALLTDANLASARGPGASFAGATGARPSFARGTWDSAVFERAELAGADFTGASLAGARFDGAALVELRLDGAQGEGASFDGARLPQVHAEASAFTRASFRGVEAGGSAWERATLDHASFADADLGGADLTRASCAGTSFANARAAGANLSRLTGDGADFTGASLDGADLRQARMDGAVLKGAGLQRVVGQKADLSRAVLDGADLTGANLRNAKLAGASLKNAVLEGADLRDADLERADVTGASRKTAKMNGARTKEMIGGEG